MDLKGIVFDKDGTLFDFEATWGAWCQRFLASVANGPDQLNALADCIGYQLDCEQFLPNSPVWAETPDTIADHLMEHLPGWSQVDLVAHMNRLAAAAPQVPLVPLGPVFHALAARDLTLGLVTNDAESAARAHLSGAGVLNAFAFVAGFDSGYGCKPDPGPLLAFAVARGLAPEQVAMVGDSAHDMHAARAAGMVGVAVTGNRRRSAAAEALADVSLTSVADLPGWFDDLK